MTKVTSVRRLIVKSNQKTTTPFSFAPNPHFCYTKIEKNSKIQKSYIL